MGIIRGLVFLLDGARHVIPVATEVLKDGEVGVAAILEDARLDVAIALLGIVVHARQPLLRVVVHLDEVLHRVAVLLERRADFLGEGKTDETVLLSLCIEHATGHGFQRVDERVVAGYFAIRPAHELLERYALAHELLILLGSLMAGVGEVEHVLLLLRIEHERVLVGTLHSGYELVAHLFGAFAVEGSTFG